MGLGECVRCVFVYLSVCNELMGLLLLLLMALYRLLQPFITIKLAALCEAGRLWLCLMCVCMCVLRLCECLSLCMYNVYLCVGLLFLFVVVGLRVGFEFKPWL